MDARDSLYWFMRIAWMIFVVVFLLWMTASFNENSTDTGGLEHAWYEQRLVQGISVFDDVTQRHDTTRLDLSNVDAAHLSSLLGEPESFSARVSIIEGDTVIDEATVNEELFELGIELHTFIGFTYYNHTYPMTYDGQQVTAFVEVVHE